MAMSKQEKNNAVLSALGHPLRRQILEHLSHTNGGVSPTTLAEELKQPLGNVSYHVRTLERTGVIKLVKTKPVRGALEHFYSRADNAVDKAVTEVLNTIGKE